MPSLSPQALANLAAMIDLSSKQFAEIHDPIAERHGGLLWMVLHLDRSRARYVNALEQADRGNWLGELTAKLIEAGALAELESSTAPVNKLKVQLQRILRPEDGFHDVADFNRGSAKARRQVCRVVVSPVGEQPILGTGFLIAPQAVLTNWHVVEALAAGGEAEAGSATRLHVEFDVNGTNQPERVDVAEDWLVSHSPYNPAEDPRGQTMAATDEIYPTFLGTLDFAVIRLARPVGRERGHYRLDPRYKAQLQPPGSQVTLYQHPAGQALKHSNGAAIALWPPAVETRLHHSANSANGSSGGLLLDARYDPIGLHQSAIDLGEGGAVNCAIPTCRIVTLLDGNEEIVEADPAITTLSGRAIIGRDDLQRDIAALIAGKQRVLQLPDEALPAIIGDLLGKLLNPADHQIAVLHADALPDDPRAFAVDLVSRLSADASVSNNLPDAADRNTAEAAWVKDVLMPPLIDIVRDKLGSKTLWLVISGMESTELFGRPRGLLLEQLLGRLAGLSFLRVILVGHQSGLPALGLDLVMTRRYRAPTSDDCIIFARRFIVATGLALEDSATVAVARAVFNLADEPKEASLVDRLPRELREQAAMGGGA